MHIVVQDIRCFLAGMHDVLIIPVNGFTKPGLEEFLEHVNSNMQVLKLKGELTL